MQRVPTADDAYLDQSKKMGSQVWILRPGIPRTFDWAEVEI